MIKLEDLQVYQLAMKLGSEVYNDVVLWEYFDRKTLGEQIVKSADSVAANISEGYGRFHYKENIHFCYYSRGSLFETKTWLTSVTSFHYYD
jgi:four helix bundle protein